MGVLVKQGTPNDVVARLNTATNKALATSNVRTALSKMAADPGGGSPEEFGALVRSQMTYWGKVVNDAGIKMHQ
jgi:tripartite-type tricarboxylate transporter receptor subunit TctC